MYKSWVFVIYILYSIFKWVKTYKDKKRCKYNDIIWPYFFSICMQQIYYYTNIKT